MASPFAWLNITWFCRIPGFTGARSVTSMISPGWTGAFVCAYCDPETIFMFWSYQVLVQLEQVDRSLRRVLDLEDRHHLLPDLLRWPLDDVDSRHALDRRNVGSLRGGCLRLSEKGGRGEDARKNTDHA